MLTEHPTFDAAELLAPEPETRIASTTAAWLRHYAALGLAAHAELQRAERDARAERKLHPDRPTPVRPDLGYLARIMTSATAAAVALAGHTPAMNAAEVPATIWDLTPEAGALNGEYLDWLAETLDRLGINPADIDPAYEAGHFISSPDAMRQIRDEPANEAINPDPALPWDDTVAQDES